MSVQNTSQFALYSMRWNTKKNTRLFAIKSEFQQVWLNWVRTRKCGPPTGVPVQLWFIRPPQIESIVNFGPFLCIVTLKSSKSKSSLIGVDWSAKPILCSIKISTRKSLSQSNCLLRITDFVEEWANRVVTVRVRWGKSSILVKL